ncbi:hypothetical protein DFH07DRAFT_1054503 [Mycena maculata]|uniref:FAD-binding PCMH-type domain-containing protein n=1 Tax=Mycena maculata TaxID=230809 RepID=A0AAD7KGB9_9AGAR|nr:hypothetical protein DFH07DRAFT_1054503 [Mycena maculata]
MIKQILTMSDLLAAIEKFAEDLSPHANVFYPGSAGYEASVTSYYWVSSEQNPLAVLQPAVAQDITKLFNLLAGQQQLLFAIKGGGHIAPPGFSSTTGLLVDMTLFQQVNYNAETQTVDIGPGRLWQDVYKILPLDRTVAGASSCPGVGVAGFNLGGGYSNKTNQFGLAIDNIQSIDVVVPSGEVLTVSDTSNEDLFWALKSQTFQYTLDKSAKVVDAIINYSTNVDPLSNIETYWEWTVDNGQLAATITAECFYDSPTPPTEVFQEFEAIPHTTPTPVFDSWLDRMAALPGNRQSHRLGWGAEAADDLPPFRGRFSCVMLSGFKQELIEGTLAIFLALSTDFISHGGVQMYPDFWPFNPSLFDNSKDCAWPHVKGSPNTPLVLNFKWQGEDNDAYWLPMIEKITLRLRQSAIDLGCAVADAPVYNNLAVEDVTVADIYQGNLHKLTLIRQTWDSTKVMDRTGGFRIP